MNKIISDLLDELSTFPKREEGLRKTYRWRNRIPMFYRPQLLTHGKHVAWLIDETLPAVQEQFPQFDAKKAFAFALVHDDPELITGDYTAGDKARMTQGQLDAIANEEQEAIAAMVQRSPQTIGGYSYEELLQDGVELKSVEAQVAKYVDRIDGFGEGLHEIYAGNPNFTDVLVNQYGITPRFDELNIELRTNMLNKFSNLVKVKNKHIFFTFPPLLNWKELIKKRVPYTETSIQEEVGYPIYDTWKKVVLGSGDSEEIKNLYTQQEFL